MALVVKGKVNINEFIDLTKMEKISHVVSSSTPKGMAADFLEKRIEELTAGKIDVQVFPNSQLYGDADEMKALAMDNVQF